MERNPFSKFYLSAHIRQKREFLGFSTLLVSEALDLDLHQYLKMENGELDFSRGDLEKLSEILYLNEQDLNDLLRFANITKANAMAREFFAEDYE